MQKSSHCGMDGNFSLKLTKFKYTFNVVCDNTIILDNRFQERFASANDMTPAKTKGYLIRQTRGII
jgi:hypothetical protein